MHGPVRMGGVDISVVCEGFAPLDLANEMPGGDVDWGAEREARPWAFIDDRTWPWHVHAFAIRTPTGLVLVDAGVSPFPPYRPWAEHTPLEQAMSLAWVDPTEVRLVVHTHLHADHAGGSVVEGEPRYPNARHVVHAADWSHFEGKDDLEAYTARGAMQRLFDLGMVEIDPDDREVWPGLRVVHAPGHTPGHRSVVLEAGDESLLLTGDLLHIPVQVARPDHASNHDEDPEEAARSRVRLVGEAASGGWRVAVAHFARPFGRVGPGGWVGDPEPSG